MQPSFFDHQNRLELLERLGDPLPKLELADKLFAEMLAQIDTAGYTARKGQIVDAAIVPASKQRNSRDENARIKAGETPEDWSTAKRRQKDVEAHWTKKHGKNHYGYKNHISIDNKHKVIRHYAVTSAEMHDSQAFETLLDENNSSGDVWADSAYRETAREEALPKANYRSKIHRKGSRKRPLNEREQTANRKRSKIRARVEHVFAQQANRLIRTIWQGASRGQNWTDERGIQHAPVGLAGRIKEAR